MQFNVILSIVGLQMHSDNGKINGCEIDIAEHLNGIQFIAVFVVFSASLSGCILCDSLFL